MQMPTGEIPIRSLRGTSAEATEQLRLSAYLRELDRQAFIVNRSIEAAWMRAIKPETPADDLEVWANLQAALFAAIVIERTLKPGKSVRKHAAHPSRVETQNYAEARGRKLRALLCISEDLGEFRVGHVRDPLEHIDERIDAVMIEEAVSLVDWYISTGEALVTPEPDPEGDGRRGFGLRVFYASGGALYFGDQGLDVFALDIAALELRTKAIPSARETIDRRISLANSLASEGGANHFGPHKLVRLLSDDATRDRCRQWLAERTALGASLPFVVE